MSQISVNQRVIDLLCRHVEVDVSTRAGSPRWRPRTATPSTKGREMAKKKAIAKTQTTSKKARKTTSKKKAPKKTPAAKKSAAKTATAKAKRIGVLDAAATILASARKPMGCREIVEVALKRKLWSTKGKTPAATLNAAMHREIQSKGKAARFAKADRGTFRLRKGA